MNNKVTIYLPTRNIPAFLERLLKYLSEWNYPVLVIDSSVNAHTVPPDINYLWRPDLSFWQKQKLAAEQAETPYVVICPTDDFINPDSFDELTGFLDRNPGYSSAKGHSISFLHRRSGIDMTPIYADTNGLMTDLGDPLKRLVQARNSANVWTMIRRETMIKASSLGAAVSEHSIDEQLSTDGRDLRSDVGHLLEITYEFAVRMSGALAVLPVFFHARQARADSDSRTLNYSRYLAGSDSATIASWLGAISAIPDALGLEKLGVAGWQALLAEAIVPEWQDSFRDRALVDRVRDLEPQWVKRFRLAFRRRVPCYEAFFESPREMKARREQVLGVQGYPWTDKTSAKAWERMEQVIMKHYQTTCVR